MIASSVMSDSDPIIKAGPSDAKVPPPSLVPPPEPALSRSPKTIPPQTSVSIAPEPLSRSLPPPPSVAPILEAASEARAKGDLDAALELYRKALFLVDSQSGSDQASIYAHVAEVKLAQGKKREAETNFEKALVASPNHLRSLDGLVALASEAKEWSRVAVFRRKRAEAVEDIDESAAELCRLARVLEEDLGDAKRAAEVLDSAALVRPHDAGILQRRRELYTTLRDWPKVLDVLDEMCVFAQTPRERAAYRFGQADIVLGRLRDEPRGLAFLELALDEDPQHDRALSALVAVRSRREEWAELATVCERILDRLAGLGDRDRAWEVCKRLGALLRDRLHDGPSALGAFRGAVDLRPDDVESRAALAELLAARGERKAAVSELEIAATYAPFRAQTYRRLYELHQRAERPDRAWLAATCLEELSGTDVVHDLIIEQFRPEGPIRPTTAVEDAWWDQCLRAPGSDPIVCDVLRAVSDAAISIRLEELAKKKELAVLDETRKQDKGSTASVVRTFVWAARALGMALPELYALDGVPSGVAAIPSAVPSTALGPAVRSGMTVQELAFVAGRHLTYYRPEHYALVFFPRLADLSHLVLSAVRLVIPGLSLPPPESGTGLSALGSRLDEERMGALETAVGHLDARGGTLDLLSWIRSVELTATRAGLVLAGDLRIATRAVKTESRAIGELSIDAKRGDLLAFCASDAYGKLRERIGVAIHTSAIP